MRLLAAWRPMERSKITTLNLTSANESGDEMTIGRPTGATNQSTPPLWAPLYGATLSAAVLRFWRKYAIFSGRASRSEFWWWELCYFVVFCAIDIVFLGISGSSGNVAPGLAYYSISALLLVFALATLIPNLAVIWRRLHDTNRSGAYFFLGFIPLVGAIILLVMLAGMPNAGGTRFDSTPS
jgi:uncharacterized membrane protein YhaH (DUF805 family)